MSAPAVPLSRLLDAAADAVAAVRAGRSLTDQLARVPDALRPGTQALAFHALRHLGAALVLRAQLVAKPPPPPVEAVLVTALALLWPGELAPPYADHTLVDQAVVAVRRRVPAAAGFVNAVLRRFVRERESLAAVARLQPQALFQHPPWWIKQLQADWPAQAADLMAAANRHPPMALRVNTRKTTVADYLQQLGDAGLAARRPEDALATPQALLLDRPCPVTALPGFDQGLVSVQDLSAQRAALLLLGLGPEPGLAALPAGARVLDACAAPGGKTAHLAELADLDLLALDSDAQRLKRVADNQQRLGLSAQLLAADARDPAAWWDGRRFDAILLDAPCSASGIVRRHPDVRWLRRASDLPALAATQMALLLALWPLLAPGGRLLYATCSLFKSEGGGQIDAFLQRIAADRPQHMPGLPGHLLGLPDNQAVQPDAACGDGFFYALITRR